MNCSSLLTSLQIPLTVTLSALSWYRVCLIKSQLGLTLEENKNKLSMKVVGLPAMDHSSVTSFNSSDTRKETEGAVSNKACREKHVHPCSASGSRHCLGPTLGSPSLLTPPICNVKCVWRKPEEVQYDQLLSARETAKGKRERIHAGEVNLGSLRGTVS